MTSGETHRDFELLARLMSGVDEIEATSYRDIVEGRLRVIQTLRGLLPHALEKALQEHLFDHLWLPASIVGAGGLRT